MNAMTPDQIRTAIFDTICAIAPETDPAAIVADQPLREQIDLDSFDFLNVIVRLHEQLGIDIPEKDYGELATLNSAIAYISRRTSSKTA